MSKKVVVFIGSMFLWQRWFVKRKNAIFCKKVSGIFLAVKARRTPVFTSPKERFLFLSVPSPRDTASYQYASAEYIGIHVDTSVGEWLPVQDILAVL